MLRMYKSPAGVQARDRWGGEQLYRKGPGGPAGPAS